MKFLLLISMLGILLLMIKPSQAGVGSFLFNTSLKITHPIKVHKNLAYGTQSWQQLNVYPAKTDQEQAPVLVFVYGGAWHKGSKEQHHFVADAMVRKGYTVVIADYIKYPEGRFPVFIEDIAQAIAWVTDNIDRYGGNPDEIFLAGHSAGAHTGALLVTDESYLQSVGLTPQVIKGFVGLAGPYNFTPQEPQFIDTFGRQNFQAMKVNNHVDGNEPPIKLMHSEGDDTVGLFNFQTFRNKLQSVNSTVETRLFKDMGHVTMVLKVHPWFADEVDLAEEMHRFFEGL